MGNTLCQLRYGCFDRHCWYLRPIENLSFISLPWSSHVDSNNDALEREDPTVPEISFDGPLLTLGHRHRLCNCPQRRYYKAKNAS